MSAPTQHAVSPEVEVRSNLTLADQARGAIARNRERTSAVTTPVAAILKYCSLVLACIVSAAGLVAVWYVVTREPSVSQNSTLVLRLDTDLHEASSDDVVRQFIGGNQSKSLRSVIDDLRKAKVDKRIGAVVIAPSALKAPFWGKIQELRDAILDYRRSGKPAIAYPNSGETWDGVGRRWIGEAAFDMACGGVGRRGSDLHRRMLPGRAGGHRRGGAGVAPAHRVAREQPPLEAARRASVGSEAVNPLGPVSLRS